jgi:hypothetical protein
MTKEELDQRFPKWLDSARHPGRNEAAYVANLPEATQLEGFVVEATKSVNFFTLACSSFVFNSNATPIP